jgi:hypothetical protein
VSGWWLPIVIVLAVMPGAEAVRAELPDEDELELPLEPPHAAATIATTAIPATAARFTRCDLLM